MTAPADNVEVDPVVHSAERCQRRRYEVPVSVTPSGQQAVATEHRHALLGTVADTTKATGEVPTHDGIDGILDESFILPTANKPAHWQLKATARPLVTEYTDRHIDDLYRVWETERPFELHLEGATVAGRADVIRDQKGGTDRPGHPRLQDLDLTRPTTTTSSRSMPTLAGGKASMSEAPLCTT